MNLFEIILLNFILLIFPVIVYLLYQTYSKTLNKEKNELYLDVALISSFYLIVRYGTTKFNIISVYQYTSYGSIHKEAKIGKYISFYNYCNLLQPMPSFFTIICDNGIYSIFYNIFIYYQKGL